MSGIAGMVLALGMAVDAHVLIYERTKEELRAGKGPNQYSVQKYSFILAKQKFSIHLHHQNG